MTRAVPDLTCKQLVELVTDYLEGDLTVDERTRFEMHLTYCGWCRTYLDQMREVLERAGEIREESLAPDARDALLATVRDWRKGPGGSA